MSAQLESLRRYVAQHPTPPSPAAGLPSVVAVGSGKGGAGTSTVAALLAVSAASGSRRVLLVDGDLGIGSLGMLLGVPQGLGLGSLRSADLSLEELLVPIGESLTLLPGGGIGDDETLPAAERQALMRRVATLVPAYDLVVIDGGSRLESVLAACAAGVGRVLAVCEPDRIAVAATYALIKALGARLPALPVELLVNRGDSELAEQVADEVRGATRHFLKRSIGYCGSVPDDHCLRAGIQAGMSVQDAAAGSPAAAAVQEISTKTFHQPSTSSVVLGVRRLSPRRF